MTDEFAEFADLIADLNREGAQVIPLRAVRVLEFLNEDGVVGTTWSVEGSPQTREVLGMLEIARLQIGADVVRESFDD